jgi:outer membrane PBP1 activator LpoA protein
MIDKTTAIQIQGRALAAVRELMAILPEINDKSSEEDFDRIRRGVGLSVGRIQMEILEVINAQHPEIDDLRSEPDSND